MPNRALDLALSNKNPARGSPGVPAVPVELSPGIPQSPIPPRAEQRSPLTDLFPTFDTINAGFTEIALDGRTPGNNKTNVYCLRSIQAGRDYPSEFAVFGVSWEMMSCDTTGEAGIDHTPVAWGLEYGRDAMMFMGIDLPVGEGEWREYPIQLPGQPAFGTSVGQNIAPFWTQKFPAGSWASSGATLLEKTGSKSWAPWVKRVPFGSRLQICFGVRVSAVNSWNNGGEEHICGYANVQVSIGATEARTRWNS